MLLLHAALAGVSLSTSFLLSGPRKKIQKVDSHVWHHCALPYGLFFFLWLKWASSWSSQCTDFLCGLSFPTDIIISCEGTHCRPKARSQKLYTITYVAFYQSKQPQHRLMQKRNKLHFRWECVCYIWGKHNTDLLPQGKSLTDIHSCCAVNQHDARTRSHRHYTWAPSQWQRGRDPAAGLPPRHGNALAAYSELWAPQEPDIEVTLRNKFHSPAPEEWMHSLALVNTLVSSNMYVMLGGGGKYKLFIPLITKEINWEHVKEENILRKKTGRGKCPTLLLWLGVLTNESVYEKIIGINWLEDD